MLREKFTTQLVLLLTLTVILTLALKLILTPSLLLTLTLTLTLTHTHTHTQPFNGLWSGTTRVGRYQKKQFFWIFVEQGKIMGGRGTDSPGGRHPNRTNSAPTPTTPKFFTGRMPFLPPNQQRQSTEGIV